MKKLLLMIGVCVSVYAQSQTVNMPNGGTTTTCSGTFNDQGGPGGNYPNSSTRVHTICPNNGTKVRVTFTQFSMENGVDFLEIFDGTTVGATSLGSQTGTPAVPFNAEATVANASGCLTFRFTSNIITAGPGWASNISCFVPCQTINANLVSTTPASGAGGIIRVCQGQSVNFVGSGTFSNSGTGATYTWDFGDGTTGTGTNVNHSYPTSGSYVVNLTITDPNGCTNANVFNKVIQVSTTPTITTSANPTSVCPGQASTLTGGVTMTPYVSTCSSGVSQTVHLPDGTGVSYESPIDVDCYASNATVTSANDIGSICLNMEHSFAGDISISIRCPNGQQVTLKTNQGIGGGGGNYLGEPNDNSTTIPGTGRVYCFTPTATTLLNNGATSPGGTPSAASYVAGNYMPQQSLNGLIGCPLNGNWRIVVTDNLPSDDGFVFDWTLSLATPPLNPSFTPTVVTQTWVANPELTGITNTNATATPTTPGNHCYTYTVTDNFGCTYTGPQCITVTPGITPNFNPIPAFCQGSTAPTLPATSTNNITGTWSPSTVSNTASGTYTFTPNPGQCAVPATLNVTVTPLVTPTFTQIAAFCSGSPAPTLPTTSNNGIAGTWSPATVNNTTSGTYTFTPNAGICATTTTMSITVNQPVTPTFTQIPAFCSGSTAPSLPTTSNNSIPGTWSPSTVNNTASGTYTFTPAAGQCATTTTMTITVNPQITPTFTALANVCQNSAAVALPTTSNNGIPGTWSPTSFSTAAAGTFTATFTPAAGQCATTTTISLTVNPQITPAFTPIAAFCSGSTAPTLPTTSNNGITGTWSPSTVSNTTSGTYTFTPNGGQCAIVVTLSVTVNQPVTPTFTQIAAFCSGSTAPTLPTTSNNGIAGTWSPSTVSNTTSGTYTFTPNAGICATTTTMSITVNQPVTPTFTQIPAFCSGSTAPTLPTTSTNSIPGTWSPSTVNNTASGTYTFTPAAGQCATTTTMTITVNPQITPTFTALANVCQNSATVALPTTSNNGIPGTWSPASFSTATAGTFTATFTPAAGQCATTTTISLTVNPEITPAFTPIAAFCSGSPAPVLSTTSNNGITGTWSPSTVSNTTSGTYTFTPNGGQCAIVVTLSVTVNQPVTPTFTAIPQLCVNDVPPALPATSNNGIAGTWNPGTIDTSTDGQTVYTFTPNAGICATTTTLTVTVGPPATPTFTQVAAFCAGSPAPVLPTTSNNSVAGSWSPATVDNMNSGTYTFTPNAGFCAVSTTMTITVNQPVTPTFTQIPAFCSGSTAPVLPTTSTNGIPGTWSPSTVSNTTSGTYTFTPAAGQCATTTTMNITVDPQITPTFAALANVCQNSAAVVLPTTSTNGYTGTWNPASFATGTAGTFTATFTPNAGQCATTATISITVDPQITPTFTAIPPLCVNDVPPALPATSNNGIAGTWNPGTIDTSTDGQTVYTFTPNAGICATTTTLTVTVGPPATPTFTQVAAFCAGSPAPVLPTTSTNSIAGTWSPATVDNMNSGTYTFTPNAGFCAVSTTMTITVNQPTVPTFTQVASFCAGSTAPVLPTTSTNGISGTWSPAVSTTASGTYTFTPNANECATTTTMSITVIQPTVPTFTQVAAFCAGTPAPVLPTTSDNTISGTWAPAVSNTASGTYTFTPNVNECATTTTMSITVIQPTVPTFTQEPAFCAGTPAPVLPTTSNNGVNGTWSPNPVSNTASGTYTFTPNTGECATTATMTITVNQRTNPTFTQVAAFCAGTPAPVLPTTSTNGVSGTWAPQPVSNTASGTYTFTPNAGECANPTTMTITVNQPTAPLFTQVPAFCANTPSPVLPTTSNNGISGTWSPQPVSNTTSGTYTFTPNVNECATTTTMDITINQRTVPTFAAIDPFCAGTQDPVLPTVSTNGISGTWSPAVNNMTSGTYTFTPNASECATPATLSITVYPNPVADFDASSYELEMSNPTVHFTNQSEGCSTYDWEFGDGGISSVENPSHTYPEDPAGYTITLTVTSQYGCVDETSRTIRIKDELIFYVPNAFTPDGDAYNNVFQPVFSSGFDPQDFTLYIYDRWGELLFESHDDQLGWDGTYRGQLSKEGVYTWMIDVKNRNDDKRHTFTGHVNLLR